MKEWDAQKCLGCMLTAVDSTNTHTKIQHHRRNHHHQHHHHHHHHHHPPRHHHHHHHHQHHHHHHHHHSHFTQTTGYRARIGVSNASFCTWTRLYLQCRSTLATLGCRPTTGHQLGDTVADIVRTRLSR